MNKTRQYRCEGCGSTDFIISEFTVYWAATNEDGQLVTTSTPSNGIDRIDCKQCGDEQDENSFEEIIWN